MRLWPFAWPRSKTEVVETLPAPEARTLPASMIDHAVQAYVLESDRADGVVVVGTWAVLAEGVTEDGTIQTLFRSPYGRANVDALILRLPYRMLDPGESDR